MCLRLLLVLLLSQVMIPVDSFAQEADLGRQLHDAHDQFVEPTLTHRRFKHNDLLPLIDSLRDKDLFAVSQVGQSVEERAIYQIKAGTGPAGVLLWSQMHGDEATATMALFDIFNFLQGRDDGFDELRQTILSKTTLYFVPMLNPDGAERFQRRNAYDIDLNRDALRLQSPEAVLLKSLQQTIKPLVGFNLHDQNPRYTVGKTGQQATLSFLATAYDKNRSINDVRKRSMQLIAGMNRVLQPFIPGHIGRYDDEFEPRAFGDNIQKWGTTLILIESGGYPNDPEKMYIRKLNFVAILTALKAIADESYSQESLDDYQAIPENGRPMFDLLIRNARVSYQGRPAIMDIGIDRHEVNTAAARTFVYHSVIEDVGDLSTFHGLTEIDATGLQLSPARLHTDMLISAADLNRLPLNSLRQEGIVAFKVKQRPKGKRIEQPAHLLWEGSLPAKPLRIGQIPTFLLKNKSSIRYVFVNGFEQQGDSLTPFSVRGNGIVD